MKREWLLPNGIGGYAMGTAAGINTRRYHGLLVAATKPPTERMVLLSNLEVQLQVGEQLVGLSANEYPGAIHPEGHHFIDSFDVGKSASWRYHAMGAVLEKTVIVHRGANAVTIRLRNLGTKQVRLFLKPLVQHKFYHGQFRENELYPQGLAIEKDSTTVSHEGINLILSHVGCQVRPVQGWYFRIHYFREAERGLPAQDDAYCPCELLYDLAIGEEAILTASEGESAEPVDRPTEDAADHGLESSLREAGSLFVVETPSRSSILAGYPWFTDWGRDTMIALPGICLKSGRIGLARRIIRDYLSQMKGGIIPNRFVDEGEEPEYHTVDATLWLVNAIYLTLRAEWDPAFAEEALQGIDEIVKRHVEGTNFGIGVDPADGLLQHGAEGLQLTWMDAKVGDWVVTPRDGKSVEINGLWINALRCNEWLCGQLGKKDHSFTTLADLASTSFNEKFWSDDLGYYLDRAEPRDESLRPNQVLAMALPFSPCDPLRAKRALRHVTERLLTPVGLRTLSPDDPSYQGRFEGGMPQRDAAYHQGTVWPWLLGPYATAMSKFGGADRRQLRRLLRSTRDMLSEYGFGGIAEVYDGDAPHRPGGCPWQAWSVAEILRAWVDDAGGG